MTTEGKIITDVTGSLFAGWARSGVLERNGHAAVEVDPLVLVHEVLRVLLGVELLRGLHRAAVIRFEVLEVRAGPELDDPLIVHALAPVKRVGRAFRRKPNGLTRKAILTNKYNTKLAFCQPYLA